MSDCLFCKIARGEARADVVYQDKRAVAFRDISPQAPTHIIVIPREHVETIDDIKEEHEGVIGHLFRVASRVAAEAGLTKRGYRTVVNCKADGGQSVYHVHMHVLGGRSLGWPPFPLD